MSIRNDGKNIFFVYNYMKDCRKTTENIRKKREKNLIEVTMISVQ